MLTHDRIVLDHLDRMTDSTGLIQHAIYSIPRRDSGYTTDDNARALRLCARLWRQDISAGSGAHRGHRANGPLNFNSSLMVTGDSGRRRCGFKIFSDPFRCCRMPNRADASRCRTFRG